MSAFCKMQILFEILPVFRHFRKAILPTTHQEDSMKEIGHWINGKHVKGTSGRFADVFNPATGEVQARVALATKAELTQPSPTPPRPR
jgi:hypothetical protein